MLRVILLVVLAIAIVAMVTRAHAVRRLLYVVLALMLVYGILKLTGVIEAIAPDRTGVF